jgi:type IV pilus assembly protein PilA
MQRPKSRSLLVGLALLAVAAVVATVAIPAWRSHQISSRLDQALQAGDAAKLVVMEAATMRGGLNHLKPGDLTFNAQSSLNTYVSRVDISESGRITIATRDTGAAPDPVFLLTPLDSSATGGNGALTWSCDLLSGDTSWMPSRCTRPAMPPAAPAVPTSSSKG